MMTKKDEDRFQDIGKPPGSQGCGVEPDVEMAFNQEDLDNLFRQGTTSIYLVGGTFLIPAEKQAMQFLELNCPTVTYEEPSAPQLHMLCKPSEQAQSCCCSPDTQKHAAAAMPVSGSRGSRLSSRISSRQSGSFTEMTGLCGYGLDLI